LQAGTVFVEENADTTPSKSPIRILVDKLKRNPFLVSDGIDLLLVNVNMPFSSPANKKPSSPDKRIQYWRSFFL